MEVSISMLGDLHNHSTCSDGSVPIHRLPLMAARAGLDTMAISDHDTLLSVNYCYEHPVQDGVRLLPATELTGYDHEHHHRVHLLCYYPDPESRELREHCDILRQRRNECGLQSAKEIEALYPQFRTEQALEYAKDSGVLFKSGIMEALHQLGLCDAVYGRLYSYLFGWEPRGVVLHQVKYPSVQEVLATAKAAGAVVVFAHPTVYKSMPLVRQLAKEGMIDGIEVEHPRNSPEDKAECASSTALSTRAAPTSTGPTTRCRTRWAPAPQRRIRSPVFWSWPTSAVGSMYDRAAGHIDIPTDRPIIK